MPKIDEVPHLTKQDLYELLKQRVGEEKKLSDLPNPALLQDGEKAAKRIAQAIQNKEKITLIGDYDVDGVSSTAIMVDFFRQIPYPLESIIPNRFRDGYGVNPKVLKRVDADVVITVDNGIAAIEAARICKERGIDLIITDHHTPGDILPDAYALVDPKLTTCQYPFKEICGAQVAWLVLALVKKELSLNIDMKQFLDILAIAIIADVMPLHDINRALVKAGLSQLLRAQRPSSIIIRDFLNKNKISSEDIAFSIAPRLNSAGRMEDASIALEFFTAPTLERAYKQFELLGQLNELRKTTEAQNTEEAVLACSNSEDKVLVVLGENWHEGVVGIVAARLVDRYNKPAIVLSLKDGVAKGSARSYANINIYDLLHANKQLLQKFGGHKMAAGLSLNVDDVDTLRDALNTSTSQLPKEAYELDHYIDGVLDSDTFDYELLNLLEQFEPYGEANPRPKFLLKDAHVLRIEHFGKEKNHSKIQLKQYPHAKNHMELIRFKEALEVPENRELSCIYSVNKNEFNNRVSLQLLIDKIIY